MAAGPTPPHDPSDPSGPHGPALPGPAHRPLSPGGTVALLVSAVLYPLVTSGVLLVAGALFLFALTSGATGLAVGTALVLCVLLPGAHWLLLSLLRRVRVPRPGAVAILLTGSVVLAFAHVAFLTFAFDTGWFGSAPLTAAFQGAVAATVLAVSHGRAFGWAWAAVCAVAVVSSLLSASGETLAGRQEARWTREVAAYCEDYAHACVRDGDVVPHEGGAGSAR
ncbi:hypothetical protein [Nocardiopsis quinghaiensis]|uniref:hypothetical protein n=1 Tax=Nocardiopsis quinghaiensis TaxID=464995 RepID=UPI001238C36A|nr:hypothetical protein [Nocardiopsis quinghaiensis]